MKNILIAIVAGAILGCASKKDYSNDSGDMPVSKASADAYGADGFIVERAMPYHESTNKLHFFYRQCDQTFNPSYYSRTSYECWEKFSR